MNDLVARARAAEGLGRLSTVRRVKSAVGVTVLAVAAISSLLALAFLLIELAQRGLSEIDWDFLTSYTSRLASRAGIKAAIVGTAWIGATSMLVALPLGIMAAIYLNEFAPANRVTAVLRAGIANLAGVPSIVFGLLGLALFVRAIDFEPFGLGMPSVGAAGMTLGLLTLPIVIVVSEEALKSVPNSLREAAFGLGASRWQVVRHHVLPYALPGMLTGAILALSRTMGETAPLIVIGAATYIDFLPNGPEDRFTALPIQAYFWAERPSEAFHSLAWAAILVLIGMVLLGNLAAILLRDRFQRRYRW